MRQEVCNYVITGHQLVSGAAGRIYLPMAMAGRRGQTCSIHVEETAIMLNAEIEKAIHHQTIAIHDM